MTLMVFLAVLGAAALHALWNAVIKLGTDKLTAMTVMSLVQGGIGLAIMAFSAWPPAEVWPWLIASGLLHSAYKAALVLAYMRGDLSRVYPLARGAAPMIVLAISALFLAERLAATEVTGILILGAGIVLMARGAFSGGEDRRLLPFAAASACFTAGYSLVDGLGARLWGDAAAFVGWMFFIDGVIFCTGAVAVRGAGVLRVPGAVWRAGSLAAALSYGAYAIAVWAMTVAPIALVTALRETSILFAVLIGWLAFGERMDRAKALAAALIVAGVAVTRL